MAIEYQTNVPLTYLNLRSIIWITMRDRAVEARRAHNPEVAGSNPAPATKNSYEMTPS